MERQLERQLPLVAAQVLLTAAEQEGGDAAAIAVERDATLADGLPGFRERCVVAHVQRALEPALEGDAILLLATALELTARDLLGAQAAVLLGVGRAQLATQAEVPQVAVGDTEMFG